jgi:hypothetical protein
VKTWKILLTSVISICGQQCNNGIRNTNTFLHLPLDTYSAAVFMSKDGRHQFYSIVGLIPPSQIELTDLPLLSIADAT